MSKSNSTTVSTIGQSKQRETALDSNPPVDVDLFGVNVEHLLDDSDYNGESLVDFEEVDVVLRDTGLGENLGDGECRSNTKRTIL